MKLLSLFLFGAIFLASCRTNDIASYPLKNTTVLYRTTVAADAAEADMHITSPSDNIFSEIFTGIGAGIAGAEAQEKLRRAINGDSLASALALGVENTLSTYFHAKVARTALDTPDYIVEVELEKYELHSGQYGLYAAVSGTTRVIQAGTAKLIWENCESVNIPLRETYGAGWSKSAGTATSIYNASELLNMSDEELRSVMQQAATEAGRDIGEQLREDAADE